MPAVSGRIEIVVGATCRVIVDVDVDMTALSGGRRALDKLRNTPVRVQRGHAKSRLL